MSQLAHDSIKIDDDCWYYENNGGIEIVLWVDNRKAAADYRKVETIKIPWRKLRASLKRKDATKAKKS